MSGSFLTHHFVIPPPARPGRPSRAVAQRLGPPRPALGTLLERAEIYWRRYRSRMVLARLDGDQLRDIGVTFAEAEHEANKPFWRG